MLVKWVLAVPHYVIVGFFLGGAGTLAYRYGDTGVVSLGGGLVGVLVLVAGITVLFRGRYPAGIFGMVVGMDRWAARVIAYAALMTNTYPPFRLDQGGSEPAAPPPLTPRLPTAGQDDLCPAEPAGTRSGP